MSNSYFSFFIVTDGSKGKDEDKVTTHLHFLWAGIFINSIDTGAALTILGKRDSSSATGNAMAIGRGGICTFIRAGHSILVIHQENWLINVIILIQKVHVIILYSVVLWRVDFQAKQFFR
jgi:hypothetical protein